MEAANEFNEASMSDFLKLLYKYVTGAGFKLVMSGSVAAHSHGCDLRAPKRPKDVDFISDMPFEFADHLASEFNYLTQKKESIHGIDCRRCREYEVFIITPFGQIDIFLKSKDHSEFARSTNKDTMYGVYPIVSLDDIIISKQKRIEWEKGASKIKHKGDLFKLLDFKSKN